jgi:beta-galactosidase
MYMFHGGTTRGFMNGANFKDGTPYEPQISSYDYDAPLDEAGNATEKYMKFREVIKKHLPEGQVLPEVPSPKPAVVMPQIELSQAYSIFNALPAPVKNVKPLTFEDLNQDYGFVLYRTTVTGGRSGILKLNGLRDYAVILINGKKGGTLDRRLNQDSIQITLPKGNITLDILVENLGRINFGKYLLQNKKGITQGVQFSGGEVTGWQMYGLPFNDINHIKFTGNNLAGNEAPAIKKGSFDLQTIGDTYLDMRNWGKGVVWVNGHNLGRYWSIGPQQTLYLPAEWLKKGKNEVAVFELIKTDQTILRSTETPILSELK